MRFRHPLRIFSLLLAAAAGTGGATAATITDEHSWCGTTRSGVAVAMATHRDLQGRLDRDPWRKAMLGGPQALRDGNIAVLVDDGSIIREPNPFDLDDAGIKYTKKKKGLVASGFPGGITGERGVQLDLGDDSSVLVKFPKGFRFNYFGKNYTGMWVNSDGNLTFVDPDFQSTERSAARFLNGPPRIAPFFADLNPETATGDGGIYLLASKTKVVVTWLEVPQFGTSNRNTFQVTLLKNGTIVFGFAELGADEGVVGVAPGSGGDLDFIDHSAQLPTPVFKVATAEQFSTERRMDEGTIARTFLSEFADDYDHLIVWLDFPFRLGGGAFAYEFTLKNEIRGIGLPVFDNSREVGSAGRLRSFVQMGNLARFPTNPDQQLLGTNSTMDVLGQETGHRWLAFLSFRDSRGQVSTDLLGRDLAHWNFNHDTNASDMEGNGVEDQGGGTFRTVSATDRFSTLDRYAMGLIPASEVPPFFYVADSPLPVETAPEVGVQINGRRVDVSINQVIAAEGARVPASAAAPKTFNMAFVLVTLAGAPPNPGSVAKLETYRQRWESYFREATDNLGDVNASLR